MAKEENPQFDVFISHASRDSWVAQSLAAKLRQEGVIPFLDTWSINAGEKWSDSLAQAVANTNSVLLVLSWASAESPWTKAERDWVVRSGKGPLLAVRLDESPVPDFAKDWPSLPLNARDSQSMEDVVERIATSVKASRAADNASRTSEGGIWAASPSIPPLDERGFLPPGNYEAPLEEVVTRFGAGTPQRAKLGAELRALESRGRRMGAEAIILGGSFVSSQPAPNDLDIVFLIAPTKDSDVSPADAEIVGKYMSSGMSTFVAYGAEGAKGWTDLLSNSYLREPRGVVRIGVSKAGGEVE